jgi:signal transduction histidine kinase/CheY-like chemotaxis protein
MWTRRSGAMLASPDGAPARRSRPDDRRWLPLAVLGLGLVSIALLVGTDHLRQRSVIEGARRLQAMGEIRAAIAISHLWLEEYVSGDEVDVGSISAEAERALALAEALLGPAPADPRTRILEPLEDPGLRRRAAALQASLEEFRAIAGERREGYERRLPVGIGSALDVEYDRLFTLMLAQTEALETALEEQMESRQRRSRGIFLVLVSAWSAIIAFAAAGLWSWERHRRQAEAALDESRAQLLHSQKLEAVGRLAGGIAHDINNYLAAIRSQCELVRMKRPPGDRIGNKMEAVIRTVSKATTLIDRLLTFSRRQPAELEVLDLDQVISGIEKMMRPSLGERVRLHSRPAKDLWHVEVDLAHVEQVLVNLLVNARDAMPDGGEIVIATENRRLEPGGELPGGEREAVVVRVQDSGRGIPEEERDKIFEPFWSTKKKGAGGGLGLATVFSIVQQSGGRVEVASEVGRGTTFEVLLPRCRKSVTAGPSLASSLVRIGGRERILLVDDNEEFRDSVRELLEVLGYRVTAVADGEQALRVASEAEDPFELVLTDVIMPGISGPELVTELRRHRPLPAVFLSGHADDALVRHGVGPDEPQVLKHQFSATRLARQIREILDRQGEAGTGAPAEG